MGRFRNLTTEVVVTVDDSKDERFADGWESASESKAKKSASSKSSK